MNFMQSNTNISKYFCFFVLFVLLVHSRNQSKKSHEHSSNGSATNAIYSYNKTECVHSSNEVVAPILQLLSKKSTKLHSSNEISTKCCRPNAERIVHLLKQSMLSANELEHASSLHKAIAHECYLQLSRKLLDSSFVERYV